MRSADPAKRLGCQPAPVEAEVATLVAALAG
jgi:hypothetical protein